MRKLTLRPGAGGSGGARRAGASRTGQARIGSREPVVTVLIVLGCVLAPISVIAVWTSNQVSNTSRPPTT